MSCYPYNNPNIYVLIIYKSYYKNENKIMTNNICYPINTNIFNLEFMIQNIKLNKVDGKLNAKSKKIAKNILRFSDGPYYFEEPTHIFINKKFYFESLTKKEFNIFSN